MARGEKREKTTSSDSKTPSPSPKRAKISKIADEDEEVKFIGAPVPDTEARSTWPHRYQSQREKTIISVTLSDGSIEEKELYQAKRHFTKALVDGILFDLFDDVYTQASEDEPDYIGKIVEMFETVKQENYARMRWFYRAKDTVIKDQDHLIDKRRVFYSDVKDDNPLDCINSKIKIIQLPPNMDIAAKEKAIQSCDFYVDMSYTFPHAFTSLFSDIETPSLTENTLEKEILDGPKSKEDRQQRKLTLLDLYSGCGAMSSGLSIGALLGGEDVVTRWAVDFNAHACESLKSNHPNTEVRNEDAEDYFVLLKEWEKLCKEFELLGSKEVDLESTVGTDSDDSEIIDELVVSSEEYEVEKLLAICYGNPNKLTKRSLHFKVRWKGYGPADDTWEPIDGLSNCEEKIKEFVFNGRKAGIIPLPGDVDFICGGPPCQGISGFNRFRDFVEPLEDKKNRQLIVYMNIVEFLKPRFVLMENVTDILKFAKGKLTNYAVGRLVSMNYQARLGIMAAGAYGVPQCRMRFFLWGAGPTETLPQFPLPTHEIMKKGVVINEFKENIVGNGNGEIELLKPVLLGEAISDLPAVTNYAEKDELPYGKGHDTTFQKFIRLKSHDIFGYTDSKKIDLHKSILYDHRPLTLSQDDYERVCHIPKVKGANYRDMPGVIIGPNNVAKIDESVERKLCKSGKPLVPNYAIKFEDGKSIKPFGRLGMDDIVATVVTRAEPHNQVILHLNQDRVLTIRENARLQGFPDCYKLYGPVKERYMQVGNAVSFSVSVPLGYCLAKAIKRESNALPLNLPFKFPDCFGLLKSARQELEESIS